MSLNADMFPARAGMSRFDDFILQIHINVPRASGDEPREHMDFRDRHKCSPRERG